MKYAVHHVTRYSYSQPVSLCHNQAHLLPLDHSWQHCREHQLEISPHPATMFEWTDYFGNRVGSFSLEIPHERLEIEARSLVEVEEPSYPEPARTPAWEDVVLHLVSAQGEEALAVGQFQCDSRYAAQSAQARAYAATSFQPRRPLLAAALELTQRITAEFQYDATATGINTPLTEVFERRRGVCQDFAHLQISCLRSLGLAARYVSGYLLTDPPPGQPKLVGVDASHAWLSLYCPGHGWIDLDPTNSQMARSRHVTLAWGRDYGDVCPVKGVLIGGGQHTVQVAVDVSLV